MLDKKIKKAAFEKGEPKASQFVVDLRQKAAPAPGPKKILKKTLFKKIRRTSKEERLPEASRPEEIRPAISLREKLSSLAIFNLFRLSRSVLIFLGRAFYKLCYRTGWLTVFFSRFIGLSVLAVTKPFVSLFKKTKSALSDHLWPSLILGLRKIRASLLFQRRERGEKKSRPEEILEDYPHHYLEKERALSGFRLFKPTLAFAAVLFLLVLPFKAFTFYKSMDLDSLRNEVLSSSQEALSGMLAGTKAASSLQFGAAGEKFDIAAKKFLKARQELGEINDFLFVLASIAPDKDARLAANAKAIMSAGQAAAELGSKLSLALSPISTCHAADTASSTPGNCDITEILDNFIAKGQDAVSAADDLNREIDGIDQGDLPEQYRTQFAEIKDKASFLSGGLKEFIDLAADINSFLGSSQDRRYLLVFQNNSELRATGGFIGSYALIDFSRGKIKNIEAPAGGSYDTEGGMKVSVVAPQPLWLVNPLWHFWDANWWPDWPTSAKKLMWFLDKSDGPTVDGVISLTPTVVEDLLKVTGPIDMTDKYGVVLTSDNFWTTVQELSEQKPDKTKEPKKIIGDLMKKMLDEAPGRLRNENFIDLIKAIGNNLSGKNILFYFNDPELEKMIEDYGWSGEIKTAPRDYLAVINTNIAGGKSDRRIEEKITHHASVEADGRIIDTVEIERTHTGIKREPFSGVRNVDWMRVYVPEGSELLEADGFQKPDDIYFGKPDDGWQKDPEVVREEANSSTDQRSGTRIYDESGHTVFANWCMVDPGQSILIRLKYRLPFRLEGVAGAYQDGLWQKIQKLFGKKDIFSYSLFAQKQPGAAASDLESDLSLPADFGRIWSSWDNESGSPRAESGWSVEDSLASDKFYAAIFEIKK